MAKAMTAGGVLESCLYAEDLEAAERFYAGVMGLEVISFGRGRHVFFRCGEGVLLVFNPLRTSTESTEVNGAPIPLHGSRGAGHLAFRAVEEELPRWKEHLARAGVEIESEVNGRKAGDRSTSAIRQGTVSSSRPRVSGVWGMGTRAHSKARHERDGLPADLELQAHRQRRASGSD
jgi:catechol 2,3-dioxygenase-like lactoylglutathione lyase family enzyme